MTVARAARLLRPPGLAESSATDAELLGRYLDLADTEAFAELVRRYAGMVRGVCQRILGSTADADDAFQASFLVLVRKAAGIRPRSRVGHFLYGVAYRTAVHVRSSRAARSRRHRPWTDVPAPTPAALDSDQLAALDSELAQLSEEHRTAVVLCELDGLSLKDAARRLGVPEGTLASRLARGRRRLAERLTARGLSAAVVLAAAGGANAAVPMGLLRAVTTLDPPTVGGSMAELTRQVLKVMLIEKVKRLAKGAAAVLFVGAVVGLPVVGRAEPAREPTSTRAPVPESAKGKDELRAELYEQLAEEYPPERVLKAAFRLTTTPKETVAFLRKHAKPVVLDEKSLNGWLADVTGGTEEKQAAAAKELEPIAALPPVANLLLAAAKATDDQEVRRRLARILLHSWPMEGGTADIGPATRIEFKVPPNGQPSLSTTRLGNGTTTSITLPDIVVTPEQPLLRADKSHRQLARAVLVLEQIGTPDAITLLKDIAGGHDEAPPTVEAKAALKRLKAK